VRTMEWQPTNELIDWGNEHFAKIPIDGVWAPDDSGVQYRKMTETSFALIFMLNHPMAQDHHEKFSQLMEACGFSMEEPDGLEMATPPLDPNAQAEMQFQAKQELAQTWACECGYPLANNDFDNSKAEYIETVDATTSNGSTVPIDLWRIIIGCASCGQDINVDPDDFHLLAGDETFMQWKSTTHKYTAQTREQLVEYADNGAFDEGVGGMFVILGKECNEERVPPWMWGITSIKTNLPISEEE